MGYDLNKVHIVAFIYFNFDVNVFFGFGFISFFIVIKVFLV